MRFAKKDRVGKHARMLEVILRGRERLPENGHLESLARTENCVEILLPASTHRAVADRHVFPGPHKVLAQKSRCANHSSVV